MSAQLLKNPLWFYVTKHRKDFALGMFFLLLTNGLDVLTPLLIKQGIDQMTQKSPMEDLLHTCLLFFSVMAGLAICRYAWRVFFNRYHTLAAEDLRNRLFNHLTELGPKFFNKSQMGELMSLCINDVQSFRAAIGSAILILVDGFVLILFLIPLMMHLNPQWTWKALIFIPLIPFLIQKVTQLIFTTYKIQQEKLAVLSGFCAEIVSGIRVIKSFVQERHRLKLYNNLSSDYEQACNKTMHYDSLFDPIMELGMSTGTIILLVVAAQDVFTGVATLGAIVAFQRFLRKLTWPVTALGFGLSQYRKGMASFARIKELLEIKTDTPDTGSKICTDFESLKVENLNFKYEDNLPLVLKNINFEIKRGQSVGIVGPVGSGKSTLVSLLCRLYEIHDGRILLNGFSLRDYKLENLRSTFTLIPQDPFLFSESIQENILFGRATAATDTHAKESEHFAQLVDIDREIESLPLGYSSQLGEKGVNLSGGQKQRLSLARGLSMKSPVLILDDTLSAVDHQTERQIQSELEKLKSQGLTQIIITHRLSVVENADMILVLRDGEIEQSGRHQDLLHTSPTYARLNQIQAQAKQIQGSDQNVEVRT